MTEDQFPSPILPEEIRHIIGRIDAVSYPLQGMTSQVMFVHGPHDSFVVKRATQPRYRSWLRREYTVLQALAETSLPIPRAHIYVPSALDDRESWLLMSYLPGESLRAVLGRGLEPRDQHALLVSFGQLIQAVHSCPLPAALDQEQPPWIERTLDQAAYSLQHEAVDGTPELLEYVQQNRPSPVHEILIHGDCTLDNVLVHNGAACGIIDWAAGGRGDPRCDLALATQPEREAFQSPSDYDAFYSGYTGTWLTEAEQLYFLRLDEFF